MPVMNLIVISESEYAERLLRGIAGAAPDIRIAKEGELPEEAVTGALVDDSLPAGCLQRFPHLKVIFSLSAGIDALLGDPGLPEVPIVRLVNMDMIALMREYVVYHVLRLHRGFYELEKLQQEKRWIWMPPSKPAHLCRVSVLGLGQLGIPSAEALRSLQFQVSGWSRSPKTLPGIRCVSGADGLKALLPETDILVCLLPLTAATRGLLAADLFRRLPTGASLINASRGGCHNETDLVRALDSGQLSHVTLDVFSIEPLPRDHQLWHHPRITITPHIAAYPLPESYLTQIVANLARLSRGEALHGVIDRANGY